MIACSAVAVINTKKKPMAALKILFANLQYLPKLKSNIEISLRKLYRLLSDRTAVQDNKKGKKMTKEGAEVKKW